MFDLSKDFNIFYNQHVILSQVVQSELREKKKINIERLNDGLEELNNEYGTTYKISEVKEQGSIAMSTVVQNDEHDYDIDIAIIFDEQNIGKDMGTRQIKNIIANSLRRKCYNFKNEPSVLTNCVRIEYADGYHIDFAVYKKTNNGSYYHAGSNWQRRNPMAINTWFENAVRDKGDNLRKTIRLSKMFCKSRDSWMMPGGLIQSVLCEECFANYECIDECFYYTMKNIIKRLELSMEVYNPTDKTMSLLLKEKDKEKLNNWVKRLDNKMKSLDILFTDKCSKRQAYDAWYKIFNHDYWQYNDGEQKSCKFVVTDVAENEEFIHNKYPVDICYSAMLECRVEANGFRTKFLSYILKNSEWLPKDRKLTFFCETDAPMPYEILWKIRNVGTEAERRKMTRGEIVKSNCSNNQRYEETHFKGPHFVECFVIKDGICVATAKINVPIE